MNIRYLIITALAIPACISCDDALNTIPDNRALIDTQDKVKELLVSAYPQAYFAALSEYTSDNVDDCGAPYQSAYEFVSKAATWKDLNMGNQNDTPYAIWQACYLAIATANQALQSIEKMGNPESMNPQKGEALLCRAYAHFILTNVFCQAYDPKNSSTSLGIPYMTKPESTVSPHYSRGNVADDYIQIETDIKAGLPLIDDNAYTQPAYHFNKKAAYAFAARFYLYFMQDDKSNLDKVITYADKVLGDDPASTLCDWGKYGEISESEYYIRGDAYMSSENNSNLLIITAASSGMSNGYIWDERYTYDKEIYDKEGPGAQGPWGELKLRYTNFLGTPSYTMWKFDGNVTETTPYILYPALTTDELLLDRAEAYALQEKYSQSIDDMNTFTHNFTTNAPTITADLLNRYYGNSTSSYAYYTPTEPTPKKKLHPYFTIPDGAEMYIHAILNMRRILTLHEGWRWFDIKRYGITIYRRTVEGGFGAITVNDTMERDDPRRAIQLPQEVINAGIEANPRAIK